MADYIDPVFKKKYIHPAREKKLINTIIGKKSKAAKQELAKNYLWLAFRISEKYRDKISDLEMRVGDAAIALFQAVAEIRKKPKKMKFEDFARAYIEKQMKRTVEDYQHTFMNVPAEEVDRLNEIARKMRKTYSEDKVRCFVFKEMKKLEKKYNPMK